MTTRSTWQLLKQAGSDWIEDDVMRHSAALAYYAMFAIAPMLIIAIAVAGWVFGEQAARGEVFAQARGFVGENGAQFLQSMIQSASAGGGGLIATIISVAILFVAATGVFAALQQAMDVIWDVESTASGIWNTLRTRFWSFVMVLLIAALLVASLAANAILTGMIQLLNLGPLAHVINIGAQFVTFTILFAAMFKILPDVHIRWRNVWVGAVVTALLFMVGNYLIGLYLGRGSVTGAFGAAGSLVAILVWVYYSAQIFFFGAEITQVYARERGERIRPAGNAVRVKVRRQHVLENEEEPPAEPATTPGEPAYHPSVPLNPDFAFVGSRTPQPRSNGSRFAPLLIGLALGRLLLGRSSKPQPAEARPPRRPSWFVRLIEPGYATRHRRTA
jgi:membrane protein